MLSAIAYRRLVPPAFVSRVASFGVVGADEDGRGHVAPVDALFAVAQVVARPLGGGRTDGALQEVVDGSAVGQGGQGSREVDGDHPEHGAVGGACVQAVLVGVDRLDRHVHVPRPAPRVRRGVEHRRRAEDGQAAEVELVVDARRAHTGRAEGTSASRSTRRPRRAPGGRSGLRRAAPRLRRPHRRADMAPRGCGGGGLRRPGSCVDWVFFLPSCMTRWEECETPTCPSADRTITEWHESGSKTVVLRRFRLQSFDSTQHSTGDSTVDSTGDSTGDFTGEHATPWSGKKMPLKRYANNCRDPPEDKTAPVSRFDI